MDDTLGALFESRVRETPKSKALCFRHGEEWKWISWATYGGRVDEFAKSLIACGTQTGGKVALIGSNTPEWFVADMAIMTTGMVSVPVYATNSGEQICYILNHSDSRLFVVEEIGYFDRIKHLLEKVPRLERVILLKGKLEEDAGVLFDFYSFLELGRKVTDNELRQFRDVVTPDMPSTFIYTSGTTGPPKAVILTHRNSIAAARNVHLTTQTKAKESVSCTYLSLAHVAERTVNLLSPLLNGRIVYFMGGYERFSDYLKEIRPTMWLGVPRVWEKLYEGVMRHLETLTPRRRKILDWALKTGGKYNWVKYRGGEIPYVLKAKYACAYRFVIKRLRAGLGLDRAEIFVTGGAPTSKEILDFFMSLGIWLQDVYGQTEGHGTTSFATKEAIRFGSAGKPYPLVEVRIAEDREILVRGDNVSPGYHKDPQLTEETFRDGWLYSGDLGELDEDGFLWITGRKKDIIITSGGKNITPSKIEAALMSFPLIEHAVVVGDGRKYLAALLTLNEEEVRKIGGGLETEAKNLKDLCSDGGVLEQAKRHVDDVNEKLSRVEQIKRFRILPHVFSMEGGELTHLLKIKRNVVQEKYANLIDELYA